MLYQGINISLDVLLVFLTVLVLLNSTFFIILIAFLLGLLQDFIAHHQTMGLFSFIKSLTILSKLFLVILYPCNFEGI